MKRKRKLPKSEWKKLSKREKQDRKNKRKENWKCSGKKRCHGMRSSVAKTWDNKKASSSNLKVVTPDRISSEKLDAISVKVCEATGWSFDFVRSKKPSQILAFARKHL